MTILYGSMKHRVPRSRSRNSWEPSGQAAISSARRSLSNRATSGARPSAFFPNTSRTTLRTGEIIVTSETYTSKASAKNGIDSVRENAKSATVEDETES